MKDREKNMSFLRWLKRMKGKYLFIRNHFSRHFIPEIPLFLSYTLVTLKKLILVLLKWYYRFDFIFQFFVKTSTKNSLLDFSHLKEKCLCSSDISSSQIPYFFERYFFFIGLSVSLIRFFLCYRHSTFSFFLITVFRLN